MKNLFGWGCIGFALMGVAIEADHIIAGEDSDFIAGVVMVLLFGGGGLGLLHADAQSPVTAISGVGKLLRWAMGLGLGTMALAGFANIFDGIRGSGSDDPATDVVLATLMALGAWGLIRQAQRGFVGGVEGYGDAELD